MNTVKVLHVWKTDFHGGGGGAIAMYRLHSELRKMGVDSRILCDTKTTTDPYSIKTSKKRALTYIERKLRHITSKFGLNDINIISSFNIKKHPEVQSADVVHLHGIHGFINYLSLPGLTRGRKVVFTLHDMWAYTGHCAFSYDCKRWQIGCGKCPYLNNYPAITHDNTRLEWKLKKWVYDRSDLNIISLSSQQYEEVKQSLLKRFKVYHIPNGVNTDVLEPLDSEKCRRMLGIPGNKTVLMTAALNMGQPNKGGDLLVNSLNGLPDSLKHKLVLLTLGDGGRELGEKTEISVIGLGRIYNDRLKAILFSAADIFISPSRAESFGLVVLESMACGTPVVSFRVGGLKDLVCHGESGYLAELEDVQDLRHWIGLLIENKKLRETMGAQARSIALQEYTLSGQAQRHKQLYEELVANEQDRSVW